VSPHPPKRPMRILFDNGTPAPLRDALKGHIVVEQLNVDGTGLLMAN
jgi:hypothetical protein